MRQYYKGKSHDPATLFSAMLHKLKQITKHVKNEMKLYQLVLKDKRTPRSGKFFLGAAIGYLLLPFDIIPDFIPIIGHLDDAIIVPLLAFIGIKCIPKEIIEDCRKKLDVR